MFCLKLIGKILLLPVWLVLLVVGIPVKLIVNMISKNHRLRWIYARRCRRCSKNHVLRKMGFEEHYYT